MVETKHDCIVIDNTDFESNFLNWIADKNYKLYSIDLASSAPAIWRIYYNNVVVFKIEVSNIIKLEYGSIENQFNIFNGLGVYKTKDKSNYKTFTNNILKQEDRFKNQVNNIQTIKELNNFKYEFI